MKLAEPYKAFGFWLLFSAILGVCGLVIALFLNHLFPRTRASKPEPINTSGDSVIITFQYRSLETNVLRGGDFNVLVGRLWQEGFSNAVLRLEKNGHLFEVDIHDRTNATIRYIGKEA